MNWGLSEGTGVFGSMKIGINTERRGKRVMKKIFIFGAGKYGKALHGFLKNNNVEVCGYLESSPGKDKTCEGLSVYSLEDFLYGFKEAYVILAVADDAVRIMAKSVLITGGMREEKIFDCSHFIDDNYLTEALEDSKDHYCILCGKNIETFLPYGVETELFRNHRIVGGGVREHALCPSCGSIDRDRWCLFVLTHYTSILEKPCTVLHFAPEKGIAQFISTNKECRYYSADLISERAMMQMDLREILFQNSTFDYIIVNHVLEHVKDEKSVIGELKRVLKQDGVMILSFPVCLDQDTYEESNALTKEERLSHFGQEDHVRLYGRDFKERLESYGLSVEVKIPEQELSYTEIEKYGFIQNDIILLCKCVG